MAKSDEQVIEEFEEVVNIKPKELEDWLGTEESKSVGQGESKGHAEGRKIVEIQNKKAPTILATTWTTCERSQATSSVTWASRLRAGTSRTAAGATR